MIMINSIIASRCDALVKQFPNIDSERKAKLEKIAQEIQNKKDAKQPIELIFVCTHNSRRSVFGEIWGKVAATYFGMKDINTYSGGTVATFIHPNTIKCLVLEGFQIHSVDYKKENPVYDISFGNSLFNTTFSKTFDNAANPQSAFIAVMTCEDASENCPFVPGADYRISLTYDDPKIFDNTYEEWKGYMQRSEQIAKELLYVFSIIK
jgi:protein-tyrosine phosphatase/arsenate reductase